MAHDSTHGSASSEAGAPSWETLARFLAGESPAAEQHAVSQWLALDPSRAELAAALGRAIERLAFTPPPDLDVEAALRRVAARRDAPSVTDLPVPRLPREHSWSPWRSIPLRVAAALALLVAGGFVWRLIRSDGSSRNTQVYRTAVGRSDSLMLRDGTRVLLGPGSELTLGTGYGDVGRQVELRGEALFDVRHDDHRPFRVRAGFATVADVGTTFAVRSDAGDEVRVVVTSGAVLLHAAGAPADRGVILNGGDRGTLRADGRAVADRGVATENDLAWTRGRLVFDDASLGRVRADLRRWYGIELQIGDSGLARRHLTASFGAESAQQVLDVIRLALGVTIELRGGGDTAVIRASPRELKRR
jgi:transmembrane sensor